MSFIQHSIVLQDDHDMCVLAMSTINELLYRKCTPPGSQEFFTQLYYYTLELLRDITNSRIDTLDPMYVLPPSYGFFYTENIPVSSKNYQNC
jgi:hypothetical protein